MKRGQGVPVDIPKVEITYETNMAVITFGNFLNQLIKFFVVRSQSGGWDGISVKATKR